MSDRVSVFYTKKFLQDDVCRFCWSKNATIEIRGNLNSTLIYKVEYCLDIDLSQDNSEYCPKYVCESCYQKIEQFNDFKSFCHNTNEKLKTILNNIDPSATADELEDEDDVTSDMDDTDTPVTDIKLKKEHGDENFDGSGVESIDDFIVRAQSSEFWWESIGDLGDKTIEESPSNIEIKVEIDNSVAISKPSSSNIENIETAEKKCLIIKNEQVCKPIKKEQVSDDTIKKEQISETFKLPKKVKKHSSYCNICHENFDDKETFIKHNDEEHGMDIDGRFKCFGCGGLYNNKTYRVTHEDSCKELENGYKCSMCNKYMLSRVTYEKHMKFHRLKKVPVAKLPEDNLFICFKCGKQFNKQEDWKTHKKEHVPTFVCETCGRAFTHRTYLRSHMLIHTGEKKFECEHCGYKCAQKQALTSHIRTHTNERPYQCDVCPQRCTTSSNLLKHRQLVHFGQKNFECPYDNCNKKFGYNESLKVHVATIHKGVITSNQCPYCSLVYRRRNHLIRHIHKKHPGAYIALKEKPTRITSEVANSNANEESAQGMGIVDQPDQPFPLENEEAKTSP